MINEGCIVVGLGELGLLFARGALKSGHAVYPVRRQSADYQRVSSDVAFGVPTLIAVGESQMLPALSGLVGREEDVILVQNELFPRVWEPQVENPTVAVVWTAAKPGIPLLCGKETVVYGKHAEWFAKIHEPLGLQARATVDIEELHAELVAKYAFILTINVLGLVHDVTVGELFSSFRTEADELLVDAIRIAELQLGHEVADDAVIDSVLEASQGLAAMPAKGRSAVSRLARAREIACEAKLSVSSLDAIAEKVNTNES